MAINHHSSSSTIFLTQPTLHISGITHAVSDHDLISALHESLRARLKLNRHPNPPPSPSTPLTGTVEFEKLENAEKAYATLHNYYFNQHQCPLILSHSPDPSDDPKPSARVRLIKFLPPQITPGRLFNIFRPFGPIYRISLNYHHTPDGLPFFSGTALIEFYSEPQAVLAQLEMHCSQLDRHTIAIEEYDGRRDPNRRTRAIINNNNNNNLSPTSSWAQAIPFVPISSTPPSLSSDPSIIPTSIHHPPSDPDPPHHSNVSKWATSTAQPPFHPLNPNSASTSPTTSRWAASPLTPQASAHTSPDPSNPPPISIQRPIDPCNLFIKGLGLDVESGDLFHAFKQFGTIVSARVMKNEATGISKQFGFVSFTTEQATANALKVMDGTQIGQSSNRIVVRFHELKKFKDGHPKLITISSPPPTAYAQTQPSLLAQLQATESPIPSRKASLEGTPDGSQPTTSLHLGTQENAQILPPPTVEVNHPSSQQVTTADHHRVVESNLPTAPSLVTSSITSPANLSTCGSPTTSTISSTPLSEREKLLSAVLKLNDPTIGDRMDELIELLLALPTKEKKMCLFNPQVLASKVYEAKEIIDTPDEVTQTLSAGPSQQVTARNLALVNNDLQSLPTPASTPSRSGSVPASQPSRVLSPSSTQARAGSTIETNLAPSSSLNSPSGALSSIPQNEQIQRVYSSLQELLPLSCKQIIEIVLENPALVKDGILTKLKDHEKNLVETNQWLDDKILKLSSVHQQKQKIGEKLFKILKSFGFKGCPKLTVDLLDSEDLRSLTLLMNLFPEILKEKVRSKRVD